MPPQQQTLATRLRQSAAQSALWADPAHRARRLAGMRAAGERRRVFSHARVVRMWRSGLRASEIAERIGASQSHVQRVIANYVAQQEQDLKALSP